jgi:hypothetical protein
MKPFKYGCLRELSQPLLLAIGDANIQSTTGFARNKVRVYFIERLNLLMQAHYKCALSTA